MHEFGRVLEVTHRHGDSVDSADAETRRHNTIGVGFAIIVCNTYQLVTNATGVGVVKQFLAKALLKLRFETVDCSSSTARCHAPGVNTMGNRRVFSVCGVSESGMVCLR